MNKVIHTNDNNVIMKNIKEIKEKTRFSIFGIPLYSSHYDGYYKIEWFLFFRIKNIDYTKLLNKKFDILESRVKRMFSNPEVNRGQIGSGVRQDINYIFKRQKSIDEKLTEIRDNNIQEESDKFFDKYKTSRIDIRNTGVASSESLEIIECNDRSINIKYPKHLNDDQNKGFILHTHKRNLKFRIRCVSDGELKIQLRGVDFKLNPNEDRIPIYIVYESCVINGEEKINGKSSIASHDKNIPINIKVRNKQIIDIELKWHPL